MDPWLAALLGAVAATACIALGWLVARLVRRRRQRQAVEDGASVAGIVPLLFSPVHLLLDVVRSTEAELKSLVAPGGTVALLFSDIEGSTSLNDRLGDKGWATLIRAHDEIARHVVRAHAGRVVKTQGDGFMAAFHDADTAVRCALALGPAMDEPGALRERVRLRIGVHVGEVVSQRGDYFGTNVAMAARIAGEALGGEVLVSDAVRAAIEQGDVTGVVVRPRRRPVQLRGLPGRHQLAAVRVSRTGTGRARRQPR